LNEKFSIKVNFETYFNSPKKVFKCLNIEVSSKKVLFKEIDGAVLQNSPTELLLHPVDFEFVKRGQFGSKIICLKNISFVLQKLAIRPGKNLDLRILDPEE
jgi:hypothetical protein